ncbi:MAG: cytochrome P460 family protein [Polyangia bacterium]
MRLFFAALAASAASALLFAGCFQNSSPQTSSFLPLTFPTNFESVRDCRLNVGHNGSYMDVWANPVAAPPYLAATYPLPAGSVVIAAQYGSDATCDGNSGIDASSYYVMAKEPSGYAPAANDWRWQSLDAQHHILQDGQLQTCISCHANCAGGADSATTATDYLCSRP